jgi:hypothetical protein
MEELNKHATAQLKPFIGKTVQDITWSEPNGYDTITVSFTDGTSFTLEERGQCGEIVMGEVQYEARS